MNCQFVHSFHLPPGKYFDAHPDWYSEIDGKRKHEHAQLCLTNEEMTRELINNVLETLRTSPGAKIIDVSQNDWYGFCTCAKCKAVDEAEESHAGTLLLMLNKVAEAVEKEFPDVLVESLAYQYTRKPPKTIKPRQRLDPSARSNVLISSRSTGAEPEVRRGYRGLEQAGQAPVHLGLHDQLQRLPGAASEPPRACSERPLFRQARGDRPCSRRGRRRLLRTEELAPDARHVGAAPDGEKLIDEFVRGYYGEAVAPLIHQYWDVLIAEAERTKIISAASA